MSYFYSQMYWFKNQIEINNLIMKPNKGPKSVSY